MHSVDVDKFCDDAEDDCARSYEACTDMDHAGTGDLFADTPHHRPNTQAQREINVGQADDTDPTSPSAGPEHPSPSHAAPAATGAEEARPERPSPSPAAPAPAATPPPPPPPPAYQHPDLDMHLAQTRLAHGLARAGMQRAQKLQSSY
jgi:hypothetical protein